MWHIVGIIGIIGSSMLWPPNFERRGEPCKAAADVIMTAVYTYLSMAILFKSKLFYGSDLLAVFSLLKNVVFVKIL